MRRMSLKPDRPWRELLGFAPRVADPDNIESELRPADLANPPKEQADRDQEIVSLVSARFKQSQEAKRQHERDWMMAKAFELGNQWVEWRTDTGRLVSTIDAHDRYRSYLTVNKIRPITTKLKARATMSKPDASVSPLTDSPEDKGAAEEARCVLDHYDLLFDRQHQSRSWVDSALTTSTSFLKIFWDPHKEAWAPSIDENGRPGKVKAKVGDIEEIIVPPFEIYPDPKAKTWRECSWLIHAKVVPLSYLQQKFGESGYRVQGDTGTEWGGSVEARLDGIQGDQQRLGTSSGKNSATLYELWEKPTARYPKGRLIRVAGGQVLAAGDWPYEKRDTFPFVPLGYQEKTGALWALNAVSDLIPLQRAYNNTLSRIQDRVNTDKPTILAREGAEINLGAYQSKRNYEIVEFVGEPPIYQQTPPINSYWFTFLEILHGQMEDISGVHEVSNGSVPNGVTAGNAIELLQQSDQTQMSEFVGNVESAQVERATWEIALCAQFYDEPRIIGIQETAAPPVTAPLPPNPEGGVGSPSLPGGAPFLPNVGGGMAGPGAPGPQASLPIPGGLPPMPLGHPGAPALHGQGMPPPPGIAGLPPIAPRRPGAMMLRFLKSGVCRVRVTPGSATPKTAAAKSQQILDLFRAGAFQPQNLGSLRLVTDLLNLERSDQLNMRIDAEIERQKQIAEVSQPDPQKLAAIKAMSDQQAQQAEQQHAAIALQAQQQHEAQVIQAKTAAEAQLLELKHQYDMQDADQEFQHKLALQQDAVSRR